MAETKQVLIPDIGDFKDVPVIEVLVKPGDTIKAEDPLIVLESDKATIEVPSPFAGVVKDVSVQVGDKVSEGTPVLSMEVSETDNGARPNLRYSARFHHPKLPHPSPKPQPQQTMTPAELRAPATAARRSPRFRCGSIPSPPPNPRSPPEAAFRKGPRRPFSEAVRT